MDSALKSIKGSVLASGIVSIILGILFLMEPVITGVTLCYFIGAMVLIAGIVKMASSISRPIDPGASFAGGLVIFFLGLLCIIRPDIVMDFLTIMAGLFVIADGAKGLNDGIICMRASVGGGIVLVVASVFLMICGAFILFAPFTFIMIMSGIVLLINGIFNIIFMAAFSNRVEEARKAMGK